MTGLDVHWGNALSRDIQYGYLDEAVDGPRLHHPRVVLNALDGSVLRVLREEIKRCTAFTFSIAFVSPSALAMLKTDLLEFRGKGRIVTSDYLAFNSPAAFAELLALAERGFDIRIHTSDAFHPKGYIFEHDTNVTAMVGSANLTATALTRNHEWNLLVSAAKSADLAAQLRDLVRQQILDSTPMTRKWLDDYTESYSPPPRRHPRQGPPPEIEPTGHDALPELTPGPPPVAGETPRAATGASPVQREGRPAIARGDSVEPPLLMPNRMQREALKSIEEMRSQGSSRVLVISATGTGKTILSALAVRAARPHRMLFVVHREQILDRTIEEYQRVLGGQQADYGKFTGSVKQADRRFVFATVQSLSRPGALQGLPSDTFDYVVMDEAHHAAASGHRRVLDHFIPAFLLGMTATPERMDEINVFELFNFNVAYEIRLNDALEAEMLSPFHYYGVTDFAFGDGTTTSDVTDLARLASDERVEHVLKAIDTYGQAGVAQRGLIFTSRKDEARALAQQLNQRHLRGRPLRTIALTGDDSVPHRESVVRDLESGLLDYIVTVDVFNEGLDIPSVNQVVMLRQTQSPTIFVQQLGRGLRKSEGKEYLVVIDFIGNYTNNYMIPIALFGDNSLNKESLRKNLISAEERGVISGLSSVQFDHIAHARVLRSLADIKLDSIRALRTTLIDMQNRVGRTPTLWDFVRFESADPVVLATARDSFPRLLTATLKEQFPFSAQQFRFLNLLSREVLTAKRPHDAAVVRLLLALGPLSMDELASHLVSKWPRTTPEAIRSAVDTLTLEEHAEADRERYQQGLATVHDDRVALVQEFLKPYRTNRDFAAAVDDLLKTAQHIVQERYDTSRQFSVGRQYGRKEVTRLLNWPRKWTSTLYGYRVNTETETCPIFVTLHKSSDISASTAYEDSLLDHRTMLWFTRSRRTLSSPEVASIVNNEVALHIFVKKDDAEGTDFYYLGQAQASHAEETTMPDPNGKPLPVVTMHLEFAQALPSAMYDYFHPTVTEIS